MALTFNGKEINKVKFNNNVGYTKVGNPTITDGVVSGFSTADYIKTNLNFYNQTPYEVLIKFIMPASGNVTSYIIKLGDNYIAKNWNNKLEYVWYDTSNAEHYFITNTTLSYSETYYAKIIYDGDVLSIYLSTDGVNYILEKSGQIAPRNRNDTVVYGYHYKYPWRGSIDLNETYIKVNGITWFNGKQRASKEVNYVIKDGKLVWANPNLYLASNQGSSFVKTDFRPTTNTTVIAD